MFIRSKVTKKCEICRKDYYPHRKKEERSRFCSVACRSKWQTGRKRPEHSKRLMGKGSYNFKGYFVSDDGYKYIYKPDHPNAVHGGKYILEHRLVMEEHIGRYLTDSELVHHKDENRLNNNISNLEIMSQPDHIRLHHPGPLKRWSINFDECVSCGSNKYKHIGKGLCSSCYQKERRQKKQSKSRRRSKTVDENKFIENYG